MPDDIIETTISPDAEAQTAEIDDQHGEPSPPEEEATQNEHVEGEGEKQEGDESEGEKKPKENPLQKRINEITRARRQAEAEAEALRKILVEREGRAGQPPKTDAAPQVEQPPRESDFQDFAAFQRAMLAYETRQTVRAEFRAEQERVQNQQRQDAQTRAEAESRQRADKLIQSGQEKYPDFDIVALVPPQEGGPVITPIMAEALTLEDAVGADVAYYLGKKPDEALRIASLPPARQVMEIGRLAERIQAAGRNKVTKAPPPIKPVSGSRATSGKDLSAVPISEFMAARNKRK